MSKDNYSSNKSVESFETGSSKDVKKDNLSSAGSSSSDAENSSDNEKVSFALGQQKVQKKPSTGLSVTKKTPSTGSMAKSPTQTSKSTTNQTTKKVGVSKVSPTNSPKGKTSKALSPNAQTSKSVIKKSLPLKSTPKDGSFKSSSASKVIKDPKDDTAKDNKLKKQKTSESIKSNKTIPKKGSESKVSPKDDQKTVSPPKDSLPAKDGSKDKKTNTSPAATPGPEIPLKIGVKTSPSKDAVDQKTSKDTIADKDPLEWITRSEKELKEAKEMMNQIKPVDLGPLFRNPSTVPPTYRRIKNQRSRMKMLIRRCNEMLAPRIVSRSELQRDVEGLIMLVSQEREYSNVFQMYDRTIQQTRRDQKSIQKVDFKSILKFVDPESGKEVEYDEELSESAIAYLEEDLEKVMNQISDLQKIRKMVTDKYRVAKYNLRDIKNWSSKNGIKYKVDGDKDDEKDD